MNPGDEKTFTLDEARRLLPELKHRISALRRLKQSMEAKAPALTALAERRNENSGNAVGTRYLHELLDFQKRLEDFAATGCVLRDLDRGLLDFPAERAGRRVYLCWVWGESDIAWWHDPDTGFSGRQPLER